MKLAKQQIEKNQQVRADFSCSYLFTQTDMNQHNSSGFFCRFQVEWNLQKKSPMNPWGIYIMLLPVTVEYKHLTA